MRQLIIDIYREIKISWLANSIEITKDRDKRVDLVIKLGREISKRNIKIGNKLV